MSIFERLEADHNKVRLLLDEVKDLIKEFPNIDIVRAKELIEEIRVEFKAHNQAEEHIFFNAMKEKDENNLFTFEGYEKHLLANELLDSLKIDFSNIAKFTAKLKLFRALLLTYIDEEETEFFEYARTCLSNSEQEKLAQEFDKMREKVSE